MEKQVYNFKNDIEELGVESLGAKIFIVKSDTEEIRAEYENPKESPEFCAVLQDKKLIFKETPLHSILGNIFKSGTLRDDYRVTVYVPEKKLPKISVTTTGGGAEIKDVSAEFFHIKSGSGTINIEGSFDDIDIDSASGKVTLKNASEAPAKNVAITAASGEINVEAPSEKFKISAASGKISYKGAVGEGNISVTSGSVSAEYEKWQGDLSISVVSGSVNVTVPENAGADIDYDGVSGNFKTDLGGEKGNLVNIGKGTKGRFGTENIRSVNVKTVSGTVKLIRS